MAAPLDPSRPHRAAGSWRARTRLSVPDLAWEFLRRNADYHAEFVRTSRRPALVDPRWGLRFSADPAVAAPEAEVLWRPEAAPGLVVPFEQNADVASSELRSWRPSGTSRRAEDGLYFRTADGLQLQYRGNAKPGEPLLVVMVFDQDFGLRVRAVERLNRAVAGLQPPPSQVTAAQRERLAKSLVALDGDLAGDSYRAIATSIFGADRVELELWRTSSMRAATIRLVQAGRRLMRGGYLKLLRGGL